MSAILVHSPDGKKLRVEVPEGMDPSSAADEALSHYLSQSQSFSQKIPAIAQQAFKQADPVQATQELFQTNPSDMQRRGGSALPIAGGALGGPIGASLGELARQAIGTVLAPETVPQTGLGRFASVAGQGLAAIAPETVLTGAKGSQTVGDVASKVAAATGVKKGWSKVAEMLTGKSAQKVRRLIEDPGVILPESLGGAKTVEQASAEYGNALGKAALTKPKFNPFTGNKTAMDMGGTTWEKWRSGYGTIDPQEAYDATQATKYAMPAAITERNAEKINELMQFKDAMDNILTQQKGQFKAASEAYGRAKLKEDFSQWFPRTQTGKISTVKSLVMPGFIDPRRMALLGFTSPKVIGALTAGTSAGLNVLGRNPETRQILLGILQKMQQNQNGTQ